MKYRDRRGLHTLTWSLLVVVLLGIMVPAGSVAQPATPVDPGPGQLADSTPVARSQSTELLDETPTGTVTRTTSNLSPSPGETVTFTSTIAGTAPANMSAELFNFYGNMQLEYVSFRIVASSNLTSPPLTDVDTSVIISTLADGDYSATYEWTMKVTAAVGDTIPSASQFNDQNQNFNVSATVNQVVTDHVFGGTITSTPSNPTPPAGALVTLTITISGSGPANATLAVDTSFTATQLAVEAFRSVSSTNLGTPSHLSGNDFDLITAPIESGGSYTATFEIDLRVATSVANGTAISITSNLGEENGSVVNSAVATLIAAAAPGGLEPISPATKTPAPQPTATTPYEPTPVPGVPSAPGDKEPPAAPVKALPTTGGGSGAGAGAMLSLLLAGVFAGLAAFIIGRRPVAKR